MQKTENKLYDDGILGDKINHFRQSVGRLFVPVQHLRLGHPRQQGNIPLEQNEWGNLAEWRNPGTRDWPSVWDEPWVFLVNVLFLTANSYLIPENTHLLRRGSITVWVDVLFFANAQLVTYLLVWLSTKQEVSCTVILPSTKKVSVLWFIQNSLSLAGVRCTVILPFTK